MNRRKPRLDVAVVPMEAGEEKSSAVLRKGIHAALQALLAQAPERCDAFAAGYLAGFARQQALKHRVDAEDDHCGALVALLAREVPEELRSEVAGLRFTPRSQVSPRARLGAANPVSDAGWLLGHLESLCGTRRLIGLAPAQGTAADAIETFLTICDTAADRLQTHHPTAVLRFDAHERAAVAAALA